MKRRVRWGLKWPCTVLSALVAGAWIAGRWCDAGWDSPAIDRDTWVRVWDGAFEAHWGQENGDFYLIPKPTGFHFGARPQGLPRQWYWKPRWDGGGFGHGALVPLWMPLGLLLVPAAALWYADRRRLRPGACGGCGYDRRGLAVGVKCPECGTVPAT